MGLKWAKNHPKIGLKSSIFWNTQLHRILSLNILYLGILDHRSGATSHFYRHHRPFWAMAPNTSWTLGSMVDGVGCWPRGSGLGSGSGSTPPTPGRAMFLKLLLYISRGKILRYIPKVSIRVLISAKKLSLLALFRPIGQVFGGNCNRSSNFGVDGYLPFWATVH